MLSGRLNVFWSVWRLVQGTMHSIEHVEYFFYRISFVQNFRKYDLLDIHSTTINMLRKIPQTGVYSVNLCEDFI